MMNFQLEENLNIKYDDWNHQMADPEEDSNCPTFYGNYNDILEGLALTDDSYYCQGPQQQTLFYSQGQKSCQVSLEVENHDSEVMNDGRHNNNNNDNERFFDNEEWVEEANVLKESVLGGGGGYNCDFLNSSFEALDEIDSDHLFYQKSFTELTPVKCDTNNTTTTTTTNVSPLSWASPNSVLSNSPSNSDLHGLENFQENFQEIAPPSSQDFNQNNNNNNNFSEEWLLQELLSNDSCQEFENETSRGAHDYLTEGQCQDSQIVASLNNFENMFSRSPSSNNGENMCAKTFDNIFEYMEPNNNIYTSKQDKYKRQDSEILGESSWVKEIKVGKTSRPRGPKCWEFLLRLLKDSASNPSLVKWENPEIGSFKLVEKDKISAIWGNRPSKKKNVKVIKYESFARILRYHYKKGSGMVLPVSEKHLVYKFASKVMAAYRAGKIL